MIAASSGSNGTSFLFIIVIAFALLWLIVVRPQRKKQNQTQRMLADLRVGDDVLTAGGVYGRVTQIGDDEVRLEVAPQVELRVARRAIAAILTEHEPLAPQEPVEADEDDDDRGERWQSAFDSESNGGDSTGKKPG